MGFQIENGVLVKYTEGAGITEVVIPENVTSIGNSAFCGCKSLTSIVIPQGVTSIGKFAFSRCFNLTSVNIPKSVTSIGEYAFGMCWSLANILIPEGVTSIGHQAFSACRELTSLVIPEGVINIGNWAFYACTNLTSIVIPASVTIIGQDVFSYCRKLKEVHGILSLIRGGCKVHAKTLTWLMESIWNGPEFLSETAQIYLTNPGKAVNQICESRLYDNCATSADVMLSLIELNKSNASALKRIATFALTCGVELPREKIIAIYEALKEIEAKPAMRLLEKEVQNSGLSAMEGDTGHPIEAICLERFRESNLDRGLKAYHIPLNLFEGVHYKDSDKLAPAFVLKCAIFPYMQKLTELPTSVGYYRTDFINVEPDSQIDEIAAALEREELQQLLEQLIMEVDPIKQPRLLLPYCRYGSGKQMTALASLAWKWNNWGSFQARGRRSIIVLRGAMLLNDSREAMLLVEKWGLLEEYAKRRNTTADVLRDTVLTEFGLDADGSKRYDLGNAVIVASVTPNLSVSLFNETAGKDVKSLPKRGADPEKYAAASEDFSDLNKNIQNAVKSRVERLKEDFVSGRELKTSDWKASYLTNYVLKRVASLLVWRSKQEKTSRRFMLTMDGAFIGCDGQTVEVSDAGSIAVAHPGEIPAEELDCWKTLLNQKKLAQPFVQIFEPIYDLDPSLVAAFEGIEIPMSLLRGLAKEGIKIEYIRDEVVSIRLYGNAISAYIYYGEPEYYATPRITYDQLVKLYDVKFFGTHRAVNHEIYAMDKALIENRVRNGDIAAVQASSRVITAKTVQHLIDVSIQVEKMEVTAWLMNYKNDHFPYTFADLEL